MHLPRNTSHLGIGKRPFRLASLILASSLAIASCGSAATSTKPPAPDTTVATAIASGTITIFVADSLKQTIASVINHYLNVAGGINIDIKTGTPEALAEQVLKGDPVDVFITDSVNSMAAAGPRISTPQVFASNDVVVAVGKGDPGKVDGLSRLNDYDVNWARCKDTVPCGAAAMTALRAEGISSSPNDTYTDVDSIVKKLDAGDLDAGVILRSYAVAHPDLKIYEFQEGAVASMQLEVSTIVNSANQVGADEFVTYLLGADGQTVMSGAGFTPYTK